MNAKFCGFGINPDKNYRVYVVTDSSGKRTII